MERIIKLGLEQVSVLDSLKEEEYILAEEKKTVSGNQTLAAQIAARCIAVFIYTEWATKK